MTAPDLRIYPFRRDVSISAVGPSRAASRARLRMFATPLEMTALRAVTEIQFGYSIQYLTEMQLID